MGMGECPDSEFKPDIKAHVSRCRLSSRGQKGPADQGAGGTPGDCMRLHRCPGFDQGRDPSDITQQAALLSLEPPLARET